MEEAEVQMDLKGSFIIFYGNKSIFGIKFWATLVSMSL